MAWATLHQENKRKASSLVTQSSSLIFVFWTTMFALYVHLFRLVEEEEISSEVKAEFKEKTKVIQDL